MLLLDKEYAIKGWVVCQIDSFAWGNILTNDLNQFIFLPADVKKYIFVFKYFLKVATKLFV